MDKLPPVSYLRLVDVWLISTQLVPFIEVVLLTLMELYSDSNSFFHSSMVHCILQMDSLIIMENQDRLDHWWRVWILRLKKDKI